MVPKILSDDQKQTTKKLCVLISHPLAERTFSVEFLWVVNHCFKFDPEMKHETSGGLCHTSELPRSGSQALIR